jgi:cyclic pyranopterin phosphate synthase
MVGEIAEYAASVATFAHPSVAPTVPLRDSYGRAITDLRVSITDRCNYRCVYCRTGRDGTAYSELALDDYLRMVKIFAGLGIQKVRITGGEPLLRRGLVEFVTKLAQIRTPGGQPLDIALTTNGHLLADLAQPLRDAGLSRITVSMDAVDPETFERITRVPGSQQAVLAGIRAAVAAGLAPVKVNCVLMRGWNDDQIPAFAKFAREENVIVRFIEFMPLEEDHCWTPQIVVPIREVEARLAEFRPLRRLPANSPSETARRYTFDDGIGEIGIIAPVSQAFCGACSRIRLTSDGQVRTCLFSQSESDLFGPMQRGATDEEIKLLILRAVASKEERHHIGEQGFLPASRTMVHIGG